MVYCPQCGQPLNGDELFCTRCGRQMNQTDNQPGYPGPAGYEQQQYQNGWQRQQQSPPYPNQQPYPYTRETYGYPPAYPGNPNDSGWVNAGGYLAWAIVCFFLFWPLAIPAVIFASKIDPQNRAANYPAAAYYAKRSKTFSLISTCIGGAVIVFSFIIPILTALLSWYW